MKMQLVFSVLCVGLALAVRPAMCDESEKKPAPPQNVGGIDAKDSGTITGIIRFKGEKPEAKPVAGIAGAAFCKQCYKDQPLPLQEDFVFGKNGNDDTVANVLVYVSKGLEGKSFAPPKDPVVLDQVGCMYVPHVVAVMVGQPLQIRNSDATLHNVMTMPRHNKAFNEGMPIKDQTILKTFKEPELRINLKCFLHPWMSAYVHSLVHPFFAVTGEDGRFTIKGLPAGEYEISVLQESSLLQPDRAVATVKVGGGATEKGQTTKLDFTYHVAGKP